jgi:glycine cleavage system H protein
MGSSVKQFGEAGVVESVKAVSDIFTPVGGEIVEINPALEGDPATVNRDAFGAGWFFKVKVADAAAQREKLLSPEAYDEFIAQEGH